MTEQQAEQDPHEGRVWAGVIAVYLALLALDIWIYFAVPSVPWLSRVGFVLQVIGVAGLATGFLAATEISKRLSSLLEDLTSPNLREFIAGNFALSAIVLFVLGALFRGILQARRWYTGIPLALIYFISLPFVVLLGLAYYVLVVPPAYLAYLLVSAPLNTIKDSDRKITISRGKDSRGEEQTIDVRAIVVEHTVPLRGFLVGLASTLFAVLAKALETF
jgi:hypothetical protein